VRRFSSNKIKIILSYTINYTIRCGFREGVPGAPQRRISKKLFIFKNKLHKKYILYLQKFSENQDMPFLQLSTGAIPVNNIFN